MKFIGLPKNNTHSNERLQVAIRIGLLVIMAFICVIGTDALLSSSQHSSRDDDESEVITEPSSSLVDINAADTIPSLEDRGNADISGSNPTASDVTDQSVISPSTNPTDVDALTTNPSDSTTTPTATPSPVPTVAETPLEATYYVTGKVNVRSGPGTEYPMTRELQRGDAIDVVAVTANGWYRTVRDTYVYASLCSATPPATPTPTPTRVPSTPTPTPRPTPTPTPVPGSKTLVGEFKVTFYGPQNGSTTTASGATCVEGTTIAADWDVLPCGTVIYIENDPLGGDGYYTVQDTGSAVVGNIIDIYAADGESGSHPTLNGVKVYIVN